MEENPFAVLAEVFQGGETAAGLEMGRVLSWPTEKAPGTPHRVLAGGNTQERDALLRNQALGPYGLETGDEVLLLPIEEAQRYVILCKVVEV